MSDNPYPPGTECHKEYDYGRKLSVDAEALNEYVAWSRGVLAKAGFPDPATAPDRYLEGFDAGLEAAQQYAPPPAADHWRKVATVLLAQSAYFRKSAGVQKTDDEAIRNAVAYVGLGSHILADLHGAERAIDELAPGTERTSWLRSATFS